jgi:threonine aldolase
MARSLPRLSRARPRGLAIPTASSRELAHARGILVHMDGARLSNAAARLGVSLREITRDAGVDILSFGGTKNGLLGAEAILVFNPALASELGFIRKQGMQLASKMRFLAAQFEAFLTDELWLRNARHANGMADLLAREAAACAGIEITRPPQANLVFARVPAEKIAALQAVSPFYAIDQDPQRPEVRWVTSFDTRVEDIRRFIAAMR